MAQGKRKELYEYPPKILIATGEAIARNVKIHQWLLKNGYPELAAFAATLQADKEAFTWLMTHGFNHLAAFCNAVDGDEKAKQWLIDHHFDFLLVLLGAVEENPKAIAWLKQNNLKIFIVIVQKIIKLKEEQHRDYNDYHKVHFN
jgi:hypothetical protein